MNRKGGFRRGQISSLQSLVKECVLTYMATPDELVHAGVLKRIRVKLERNEYDDRWFYASPDFDDWLRNEVVRMRAFYSEDIKPALQALAILKQFNSGTPFRGTHMFKQLSPHRDDIWELRTPDLRFFGWFHRVDCFIAHRGDTFERLKNDKALYELHRIECRDFRREIDLDEPKCIPGGKQDDVVSE